jgi:FemAB-related protein (PEP-CTERM system-associated)
MALLLDPPKLQVIVHEGPAAEAGIDGWRTFRRNCHADAPSLQHEWLAVLREGLGHRPFCLEARDDAGAVGLLPLCLVESILFGKFLVSLPYLNLGGVLTENEQVGYALIDAAISLADELNVRHLELRHEHQWSHPRFNYQSTQKVHMRLQLPGNEDELWRSFDPKVRNQIRKGEKNELRVQWGGLDLLRDFYRVFSVNMRDVGTPVFSRRLFESILQRVSGAEICAVYQGRQHIAAALLVHGDGIVEVPSASSLRQYNRLNANMLMYWRLLQRSIERGQRQFDFGRSSAGSNTYRFKAQWGAQPHPAIWQFYVRHGQVTDMRPDNPKNQRRIAVWRRLPVWLTRLAGPSIVRGIP